MGILDDAIREHLELKLQHGADAEDVSRQEHEALGPVRREPAAADPGAEAEVEVEDEALGAGDELEPATQLSPLPAVEPAPRPEPGEEDGYEDDEELEPAAPAEPAGLTHGPGGSVPATAPDPGETGEWGFEDDEEETEEPAAGEDVLEQTPEFLSETPEHDRLWFEQKPPRDFDFDG